MYDELIVPVLVQAFHPRAVAPHAMHPRRGIGGELDPFRFERMELRVNNRAGKRNLPPFRTVHPAGDDTSFAIPPVRCRQPLAVGAEARFSKLRSSQSR